MPASQIKYKMIRLEKFDHTCYDTLLSWIESAEALMQFAGPAFSFPLTKEQIDTSLSDPNRLSFCVVEENGETKIGHAEIYVAKESAYLARIIIGDQQMRGKGLGQEIVSSLLEYAFTVLQQNEVRLKVFDWNISAIKCYEKVGFCIDPGKKAVREINGQTWVALNMFIDHQKWKRLRRHTKL